MKKYIFIIITALFINEAQSQSWQWAISCGKSNGDDIGRIAIDNNSNLYLAGTFYSSFGIFGTDTFITNGISDIVFAKLNSSGTFQWVHQIGGNNSPSDLEAAAGVNYNAAANCVFVAGMFYDSISLGGTTLHSGGANDIFFAKYDANGNCAWAKKAGSNSFDLTVNITSDDNGNLYVIGNVNDTAYFDTYAVPKGYFLVKYNNSGNCQWAKKIISDASINGISCYNNEIVVAGNTVNDTIIIDSDTLFSTNNFGADLVIAAFDLNGSLIWAKLDASGTVSYAAEAEYDNSGNIYITGVVAGFDTVKFGNVIFPPSGTQIFLVKYDNNGTVTWARESASSYDCRIFDLSVSNGDGSCYLTGRFQDTITFGNYTVNGASFGEEHMFISRYDANGDCLGIRHTQVDIDGPNPGRGYSVVQDANNICYVAGQFSNTANFDTYSLTSVWQKDIFIAKIDAITGIGGKEINPNNHLLIYANPNKGTFNIKVPDEVKTFKKAWLLIFDNTGRETARFSLDNESDYPYLDVTNAAKGMYTVKLVQGDKNYSGKLIVE
ncbi:MAG: T9SS type A sorting domain-containing protein [Bacteroidia bacterium]